MLDNFIFIRLQETISVVYINTSLVVLDNQAKTMQMLTIEQANSFTLETSAGKITATNHRDHFNEDILNDQSNYITNIKQDWRQAQLIEKGIINV